jgi:rRNA maturation RNase YbeY
VKVGLESAEGSSTIVLHNEELMPELPDLQKLTRWIHRILCQESRKLRCVYYVFLDDESLLKINRDHLQHDTYTDIITFPYHDDPIEAEIYISADRVRANAAEFSVPVQEELLRVMAHGILHLCGWRDKTDALAQLMRKRENACLSLILPQSAISPSS